MQPIDLAKISGLPISLNDKGWLEFRPPLSPITPKARKISDMREYLADPSANFSGGDVVYHMYGKTHFPADAEKFEKMGIRYDLTVFRPGLIGQEFSKTIGHFHAKKPGTNIAFVEAYEVVLGRAIFIIQKIDETDEKKEKLGEIYLIEASEGEKVIFPPGFGHTTINPTNDIMITGNWDENTDSNYEFYRTHHGAGYYLLAGEQNQIKSIPNPKYPNLPELKKLKPIDLPYFSLYSGRPMYQTGQNSPDMLQFLIKPELYLEQLTIENCFARI